MLIFPDHLRSFRQQIVILTLRRLRRGGKLFFGNPLNGRLDGTTMPELHQPLNFLIVQEGALKPNWVGPIGRLVQHVPATEQLLAGGEQRVLTGFIVPGCFPTSGIGAPTTGKPSEHVRRRRPAVLVP